MHTLIRCDCPRCERDRFEARAVAVCLAAMFTIAVLAGAWLWSAR